MKKRSIIGLLAAGLFVGMLSGPGLGRAPFVSLTAFCHDTPGQVMDLALWQETTRGEAMRLVTEATTSSIGAPYDLLDGRCEAGSIEYTITRL